MQVWDSLDVKNFDIYTTVFVAEWNFSELSSSLRPSIFFPDRSGQCASVEYTHGPEGGLSVENLRSEVSQVTFFWSPEF